MCGICGSAALVGPLDPDARRAVRAMSAAIAHRGPDGEGFYDGETTTLGHRRLAIIDRAGGAQPIANEDESCWIVFNGEVYNHRSLRPVLEARGHVFRTKSDTETILHAWEEYGTACVERLEGMFAFAIADTRRRELFIAHDRLGKKPIFYTIINGVLHFASELGALNEAPGWRGELRLDAIEAYLSLGYFLAPDSIYRGVYKLMPGHWLHVANGAITTRRYWDVTEFGTDQRDEDALVDAVDEALGEAVRERLESEVPLGAFLSGGLDSGLVVSYMAEAMRQPVLTNTVGFGDAGHNELEAARLIAGRYGTDHHEETLDPQLDDVFETIVSHLGEPMADSSAIPTWYVSRSARRNVIVALTGDGGDETFAGYDFRYVPHALEERARAFVPGPAGRVAVGAMGRMWPRSAALPKWLRAGTVLENLSNDSATAYFTDLCFLKPGATRRLLGLRGDRADNSPVFTAITDVYRRPDTSDDVQRAQYADLNVYMPNDPLVKVDRMSMAHSLEVRSPFLDRRVVELAFRIPSRRHQQGTTGKVLLRKLAARRLPPALARMPKRGFTVPIGEWIAGPYADRYRDEVLSQNAMVGGLLDGPELRRRFEEHCEGAVNHSYVLWAVWVLERWLRARTTSAMNTPAEIQVRARG
jgi:asparagine synthase (glutamine-hydrolysing)